MKPYVLDTHIWIWLAAGDARLQRYERTFNRAAAARALLLPSISLYEAALIGLETEEGKRTRRHAVVMKPTVSRWLQDALATTRVTPLALEAAMALDAATFRTMHSDPFDRMIVATALGANARLVTADEKISAFARLAGVEIIGVG